MGKIGYRYGSEWHLLRHLGYHREYLSEEIINIIGCQAIKWLDFEFSKVSSPLQDDREFAGLDFIHDPLIEKNWKSFWPQTGNVQNWDAVGKIFFGDVFEWLLVEAKGHIGEIKSKCGAKNQNSRQTIQSALEKTSRTFGNRFKPIKNWLAPYYQYANRLAILHFLMKECSPSVGAHILFVYFYGENRKDADCPQDEQEWKPAIQKMTDWLGIDKQCELFQRVHYLYLPVNPSNQTLANKRMYTDAAEPRR